MFEGTLTSASARTHDAGAMRMTSRQQGRPRRRTLRRRGERVREEHTLAREPVHRRRANVGGPRRAERVGPLLIRQEDDDVGPRGRRAVHGAWLW